MKKFQLPAFKNALGAVKIISSFIGKIKPKYYSNWTEFVEITQITEWEIYRAIS